MSQSTGQRATRERTKRMRELRVRLSWVALEGLGVADLFEFLEAQGDSVRFRSLACRGRAATVALETNEPLATDPVESAAYVESFDLVGQGPGRYEYMLRAECPEYQDSLDEHAGEFYVDGPVELTGEGLTFTVVATQDALETLNGTCDEFGEFTTDVDILRVGEYTGRTNGRDSLTDRQWEVLTHAFEAGYFEVPRDVDAADLAAEFGLDKSTVLEHLRRAERNLLESLLEEGGRPAVR